MGLRIVVCHNNNLSFPEPICSGICLVPVVSYFDICLVYIASYSDTCFVLVACYDICLIRNVVYSDICLVYVAVCCRMFRYLP